MVFISYPFTYTAREEGNPHGLGAPFLLASFHTADFTPSWIGHGIMILRRESSSVRNILCKGLGCALAFFTTPSQEPPANVRITFAKDFLALASLGYSWWIAS